jgi:hypothetical protein
MSNDGGGPTSSLKANQPIEAIHLPYCGLILRQSLELRSLNLLDEKSIHIPGDDSGAVEQRVWWSRFVWPS